MFIMTVKKLKGFLTILLFCGYTRLPRRDVLGKKKRLPKSSSVSNDDENRTTRAQMIFTFGC